MSLKTYIKNENGIRKIFNMPLLTVPTTEEECKKLFQRLASALSPENLCCDGELPRSEVAKKARILNKAWADLEKIMGRKVSESETWGWGRL